MLMKNKTNVSSCAGLTLDYAFFCKANLCEGKFIVHTVQLLPCQVVRTLEQNKMFNLPESGEWQASTKLLASQFCFKIFSSSWLS
jgi:hypothetical protein